MKIVVYSMITFFSILAFAESPHSPQKINIEVTEKGFVPSAISVKPGTDVTLVVTRKTDSTCSTSIQIPDKKIKKDLPLNKPVVLTLGVLAKGEIRFGCGMNMMEGGMIHVQ